MITYTLVNQHQLNISFPYDADTVLAVKGIPGRRYDAAEKVWTVPIDAAVLPALEAFAIKTSSRLPAEILKTARAHQELQKENLTGSSAEATVTPLPIPPDLYNKLRPFQRAGVEYALRNKNVLIGDEMGLGKTVQALATIEAANAFPCLVVCPASLKYNWQNEITKWLGRPAEVLNGHAPAEAAQFVIVNYDILKKHQDWLAVIPWSAMICDESHYIKNYKAIRTQQVKKLAEHIDRVILLSGTPVLNRPHELVSQLDILRALPRFGGFWPFVHRYCNANKTRFGWDFSGAENLDELNTKLRATCYLRRDKKSVLKELPDKTRTVEIVDITNREEYDAARLALLKYIEERGRVDKKFLEELETEGLDEEAKVKRISEYRQDKATRAARAEILVGISTLKQLAAVGKIAAAKEKIQSFTDAGEPLLVFAWHTSVIEALADAFECDSLTGDTPAPERQAMVDRFQTGKTKLLILNIQAGGVGLTLTAASHELFIEFPWSPGIMDQAEDRAHRIGQKNAVNVYQMVGRGTIDEATIAMLETKRKVVNAISDGPAESDVQFLLNYLKEA